MTEHGKTLNHTSIDVFVSGQFIKNTQKKNVKIVKSIHHLPITF